MTLPLPRVPLVLSLALGASLLAGCSGCSDDKERGGSGGIGLSEPASIQVRPARLTMPGVQVGDTTEAEVTIANVAGDGGETLTLSGAAIDPETATEFSVGELEVSSLEPGEETTLKVFYSPWDAGSDHAWLVIDNDATNKEDGKVELNTLVAEGTIIAIPPEILFGDVGPGEGEVRHSDIINGGSASFDVTWVGVHDESSPDFSLEGLSKAEAGEGGRAPVDEDFEEVSGTITMAPLDRLRVRVRYKPRGGDNDAGFVRLLIANHDTGEPHAEFPEFDVPLSGSEPSPAIAVIPDRIDFGPTPQEGRTETLLIRSIGNGSLTLGDTALFGIGDQGFSLPSPPESGTQLAPGQEIEVEVTFVPLARTDESFMEARVESDDPARPSASVALRGRLDAPMIMVMPDAIQFGGVATNSTDEREVTVSNVGTQDLEVTEIVLDDEGSPDFGLAGSDAVLGTIGPGESRVFNATFTPEQSPDAKRSVVYVRSDDPFSPEKRVNLYGRDGGAPHCGVVAREAVKNYGLVGYGRNKVLGIDFIGMGTADCTFLRAELVALIPGTPHQFSIVSTPNPPVIPSQDAAAVSVGFQPQRGGIFDGLFGPQQARLVVTYTGHNALGGDAQRQVETRVTGMGGASEIAVLPSELDFGLITLGCLSQTMTVTVYNTGIAEFSLDRVELVECGPEFEIVSVPILPDRVLPASPADISIRYGPQDVGPDACELVLSSDAGNVQQLVVPLRGEGTRERDQTDDYIQTSGQTVDVLFVVDNSASMCDEEENLADNIDRFVSQAALFAVDDFQLGVVNTEIAADAIFGGAAPDPDRGKLLGNPRIVNPGNGGGQTFGEHVVDVGCDGAGAQESGLEAARLALSHPWIREAPAGQCGGNGDCQDGEECSGGACVGWNRGFLRADATLEVVYMSDEEDQSPARVSFYIDFLKSIKGFRNEGLMHASAIVGPPGGCQSNNGSADSGNRYIEVVEATNGSWHSICAEDFGPALETIGNRAFGLRVQFFLSRVADPATIVVTVEGAEQADGWLYDEESNSVVFDEATTPEPGQAVSITYSARCFH